MPRIPEALIERLKAETSLEALAAARGVTLTRHGADLIGLCPFHDDHEPSLVISPRKNLWHCLGACGSSGKPAGGTAIDWVMRAEGVSFRHAVELLSKGEWSSSNQVVKRTTVRKLAPPIARDADDARLLLQVIGFYNETLKQSPDALAYLQKRGLTHPEIMERFRLGFSNRTLGYRLPQSNRNAGAELRGRLQKLGVYRESGHEHFNGCLVIPVFSQCNDGGSGEVLQIYGRKIADDHLRSGTPLHMYMPGPHRGVWNEEALIASKEIILCESIIDALTFWCAGFRNVTASYGVNGFTEDHKAAFDKHGTKHVWIAYDRDEAGDNAAEQLAEQLKKELGITAARVLFPRGMDANEYALKVTPPSQSLAVLLNKSEKPPPPPPEPETQVSRQEIVGDDIVIEQEDRRYRVRGLLKNLSRELLKVNVLASRQGASPVSGFHVDTLDLYSARQRTVFTKQAAIEMSVSEDMVKHDLGRVLLKLEQLQDENLERELQPKPPEIAISDSDREAALALLRDPNLMDRILEDFIRCGVVGEESNKLIGYLAAVSRRLETPLAVIVQSSSAAGKSSLMDAVLAFVPEEERVEYSAMTGQSLYYMGEMDLKHKVLAIAEEGGASKAAYALKLLQSEGALSIASTGKDPATGRLVTHQYRVEGPVMIFLTTTAIDLDEELLNRCLVLTVNEDRAQTQAIHKLQRERQTIEGLLARRERERILKLHRNAQRLLKPLFVANPYAHELTFPDHRTRLRRDHVKYLTLIAAIALLYQHQREIKSAQGLAYIEARREDIAAADRLMKELLAPSLDELPPQTRRLLTLIEAMVSGRKEFFFSRRDVREHTGWGMTQARVHLDRLVEMEYLVVHRGERGHSYVYEVAALEGQLAGGWRGDGGPVAATWRPHETPMNVAPNGVLPHEVEKRMFREA